MHKAFLSNRSHVSYEIFWGSSSPRKRIYIYVVRFTFFGGDAGESSVNDRPRCRCGLLHHESAVIASKRGARRI